MSKFVFVTQVLILYLSMTAQPATERLPAIAPLPAPDHGIFIDAPEPEGI